MKTFRNEVALLLPRFKEQTVTPPRSLLKVMKLHHTFSLACGLADIKGISLTKGAPDRLESFPCCIPSHNRACLPYLLLCLLGILSFWETLPPLTLLLPPSDSFWEEEKALLLTILEPSLLHSFDYNWCHFG